MRRFFQTPSAEQLAQRELQEAQRELLAAQSAAEYAARMVGYNQDRIKRLKAFLGNEK